MESYKPILEAVKTYFKDYTPTVVPMEVDLSLIDLYNCITKQFENRVIIIRKHEHPEQILPTLKS